MTAPYTPAQIKVKIAAEKERITLDMESGLILNLNKIAEANRNITRCLAVGYTDSNVTGAIVELRSAANFLEQTQRRYLDRMSEMDRAIQLADQGGQGE